MFAGGRADSQTFPQSTTRYEIKGLQPSTDYIITLYTLYDGREEPTPGKKKKPITEQISPLNMCQSHDVWYYKPVKPVRKEGFIMLNATIKG